MVFAVMTSSCVSVFEFLAGTYVLYGELLGYRWHNNLNQKETTSFTVTKAVI